MIITNQECQLEHQNVVMPMPFVAKIAQAVTPKSSSDDSEFVNSATADDEVSGLKTYTDDF